MRAKKSIDCNQSNVIDMQNRYNNRCFTLAPSKTDQKTVPFSQGQQ